MAIVSFKGFSGIRLEADDLGNPDAPSVLLIHGGGQTRKVWEAASGALVAAGRRVINLDLRGHGGSEWPEDARYDFQSYVEDLRAVLAQMGGRPVIVAATLGGWIATIALGTDAAVLASGLVIADQPTEVDLKTSRAVGERLRSRLEGVESPNWDVRLLDRIDTAAVSTKLSEAAAKITIPVLFVRGALNEMVTSAQAEAFVADMPSAEFAEVADADLLVTPERMEVFNGLLLEFLERKQPLAPAQYETGSDARTFRDALGCFATGVTIVTAVAPDGTPVGLTANSFTSVSLDPPLLLVCIANNAGSAEVLRNAAQFGVNVLQIGQQPTSNRFAGKGEDRFAATPWEPGVSGVPVLTGSLASFECQHFSLNEGGDHFILVGQVLKATYEPRRDPLLYFRGKYRRLHFA
jgi:flavin reductase (DIM6/NTAB) family NADH-FMN oxidoreductase RutF/pimeloyl-ACP methyl ester carboxylesterase